MRIGPEVKREKPRHESLKLARSYVIRQAHLLANANEKARAKVAARLVDQLECMSIFAENIDAAVTNHDDALGLFLLALDGGRLTQLGRRLRLGQGQCPRFHRAERLFEDLLHLGGVHVSKNGNDAIFCNNVAITKLEQILLRQTLHRIDRAVAAQGVRMVVEKRLAQNVARDGGQLFVFLLDARDLDLLFPRDCFLWHRGAE